MAVKICLLYVFPTSALATSDFAHQLSSTFSISCMCHALANPQVCICCYLWLKCTPKSHIHFVWLTSTCPSSLSSDSTSSVLWLLKEIGALISGPALYLCQHPISYNLLKFLASLCNPPLEDSIHKRRMAIYSHLNP